MSARWYGHSLVRTLRFTGRTPTTPEAWRQLALDLRALAAKSWKDSSGSDRRAGREFGQLVGLEGREGGWVYNQLTGETITQGWFQALSCYGLRLNWQAGRRFWTAASVEKLNRWATEADEAAAAMTTTPEGVTTP